MNLESGDGFLHQVLKNLWKVDPIQRKSELILSVQNF